MKIIILLYFLVLFIPIGISQNSKLIWAPVGAKWEYTVGGLSGNFCCCWIQVEKDTIISNTNCKKIINGCTFSAAGTGVYPKYYFLSVEDIDTIKYLLEDKFVSLYNFNTPVGAIYQAYVKNKLTPANDPCKDSISIRIENKINRVVGIFSFRNYFHSNRLTIPCGMQIGNSVIEVFGPLGGFLFPTYSIIEAGFNLNRYVDTCWDIEISHDSNFDPVFKINRSCITSSIKELNGTEFLNIFPNPAINHLILQSKNSGRGISSLTLYDLMGRAVLKKDLKLESYHIDLNVSHLPPGIYLLKFKFDDQVYSKKILKN